MTHRKTNPARRTAAIAAVAIPALSIAVAMLGHATLSGTSQWAEGGLWACVVLLAGAAYIAMVCAGFAARDAREERQLREQTRRRVTAYRSTLYAVRVPPAGPAGSWHDWEPREASADNDDLLLTGWSRREPAQIGPRP